LPLDELASQWRLGGLLLQAAAYGQEEKTMGQQSKQGESGQT
jgi:hypothetical protein